MYVLLICHFHLLLDISLFDELENLGVASELLGALEHADYVSPWGWGGDEIQSWANLNFSSTNNHTRTHHGIMCAVVIGELAKQDIQTKGKCFG